MSDARINQLVLEVQALKRQVHSKADSDKVLHLKQELVNSQNRHKVIREELDRLIDRISYLETKNQL